jgi:hypothetical protein
MRLTTGATATAMASASPTATDTTDIRSGAIRAR